MNRAMDRGTDRATVEQMINRFGSQQRVAELLGIWQTAVSGWVRRGAIPTRRQAQLLTIAQREGVNLLPADFFAEAGGCARPAKRARCASWPAATATGPASTRSAEGASTMNDTAKVIPLTGEATTPALVAAAPAKDLYEIGEIPPLGHVPSEHVCLGDPARAARRADGRACSRRWCRRRSSTATRCWSS